MESKLKDENANIIESLGQSAEGDQDSYVTGMESWGLTLSSFRRANGNQSSHGGLHHSLNRRQLQMIAVGGSIGTGLFIGILSIILYSDNRLGNNFANRRAIGAIIMLCNCWFYALGELATLYPVSGSFYTYTVRFVDEATGFAVGYCYWLQWAISLPIEITAAALTVQYWDTRLPPVLWITIFLIFCVILTIFGIRGFGEEEFVTSIIKLVVVLGFIVFGIVMAAGGGPSDGEFSRATGFRYWIDPGALANGPKGLLAVFVVAAFAFSGTELVGLAAAESANPRKDLPQAIRQVFWRITIFYLLSLLIVGLLVPYDDPSLLGASDSATASPFVIAIKKSGVPHLEHVINATILVAILSIGFSSIFAGSRTLLAIAESGYAPKQLTYIDKAGRPLITTCISLAFGCLAYLSLVSEGAVVLTWLLAISGLSCLFTWGSICVSHIKFRQAWKEQGHVLEELPFKAALGVWGSYISLAIIFAVMCCQVYIAISPMQGGFEVQSFFPNTLAIFTFSILYTIGYFVIGKKPKEKVDLVTGRKCWETVEMLRAEREQRRQLPMYKRAWMQLC